MNNTHQRLRSHRIFYLDIIITLIILSFFLYIKEYFILMFIIILLCPFLAIEAFKQNSRLNGWIIHKLDYFDSLFIRWLIKRNKQGKTLLFRRCIPHTDIDTTILDIDFPINTLKSNDNENFKNSWDQIIKPNPDPFHIHKSTLDLAQQFLEDEYSLNKGELERLCNEGSYEERLLLETQLPPTHPILLKINKKLQIKTVKGFTLFK